MEYAILHWLRHLEAGMSSASPDQDNSCQSLTESLEVLVEQYWNEPTDSGASMSKSVFKRTRDLLQHFSHCQSFSRIQLALVLTDKELKHFGDVRPEKAALNFAGVVKAVRSCVETYVLQSSDPDAAGALTSKYGRNLFKCPRFSCNYFTEGFSSPEERDKHVERHERPARCTDEHCRGSQIGFATQAQLDRHLKENHPDMTERNHNFPTDEEIIDSMREASPESEAAIEHEPQVVPQLQQPLAIPDPAAPPASEEAEPQPAQPRDTVKRQRTKQDYKCAHCDRTFNKKYNWESHLQTHGNNQRLQCPYCKETCARQSDLLRHVKLHNPGSAVTCGGVLSDGRRWGCGVNFARADTLRTHYKSKRGRRCLAEKDSDEQSTASASASAS